MSERRIIVIGGGASGMMAAITAASKGAKVTVLEHNDRIGKKLAATGNGKCNLTNLAFDPDTMYRSEQLDEVKKAFHKFGVRDTITFFNDLGICLTDRNGYLYPRSGQAKTIVNALSAKATSLRIKLKTNEEVQSVLFDQSEHLWKVKTATWCYEGEAVIMANGSSASMIGGADQSGYAIAEKLGLSVIKPLPALCPLRCKGIDFKQWAGVRTEGTVSLYIDDEFCCSDRGELQLTDYGISGIPVFQVSRYGVRALDQHKKVYVELDFLPEFSDEQLSQKLKHMNEELSYKGKQDILEGFLPDKLAKIMVRQKDMAEAMKHFRLQITGSGGFEKAQVCSGGVDLKQICIETMESRKHKGLYLAGELLDVDGICGGYNLQWAWTSGYIAGMSAAGDRVNK